MYVPTPPDPVPRAVIMVSCVIPTPKSDCATPIVPFLTAVTVSVVPEIVPVKTAVDGLEMRQEYR